MTDVELAALQAAKTLGIMHDRLLYLARHPDKVTVTLLLQMAEISCGSSIACERIAAAYSATKIVPISVHRNYRPVNPDGGSAA